MKKKGFTLIELLAVIIILAVIALIATPIVLNIIEKMRINAAESSAKGYTKAVEYKIIDEGMFDNISYDGEYDVIENVLNVSYQGDGPSEGFFIVEKNIVKYGEFCINGYPIKYENSIGKYAPNEAICSNREIVIVEPPGVDSNQICLGNINYDDETNFKIKKVEDLVCISKLSSEGKTFSGKTIMLLSNIDITNSKSYNNSNDTFYGDINGNGTIEGLLTEITTEKGFMPIGSSTTPFSGTFDGRTKTISNLMINRPSDNNIGLFGYVNGGKVVALNIENINVTGNQYVGGIAGTVSNGTVNEVIVNNVTVTSTNSYIGGTVGYLVGTNPKVTSVLVSNINIKGNNYVSGAVGGVGNASTVSGVVESGNITSTCSSRCYRGRVHATYSSTITGISYASNLVTGVTSGSTTYTYYENDMLNGYDGALDTWIGGDNDSSGYYFDYDENGKIVIRSVEEYPITFNLAGSGTESDPYIINNYQDWREATTKVKGDYYFKLTNDIDFSNKKYYSMGTNGNYLVGTLDGNNKTISNIVMNGTVNSGLIGYNNTGVIKKLNIDTVNIKGYNNIGIIGYNNTGTIKETNISNITVSGNQYIGGLVGADKTGNSVAIKVSNINVTGNQYLGGIAGNVESGTVNEVIANNVTVTAGEHYVGGIVGYLNGTNPKVTSVLLSNVNTKGIDYVSGAVGGVGNASTVSGIVESGYVNSTCAYINSPCHKGRVYSTHSSTITGISYASNLVTGVTSGSTTYTYYENDMLNGYDGALDTWIGGDNDSSGYYFDYDENGKIVIRSVEEYPITFNLAGSGTESDPYIINNYQDWKEASIKAGQNVYIKLNSNIDFSNKKYYSLGTNGNYFVGTLDGNKKTISNIEMNGTVNSGLIGYNNTGTIKNLNVDIVNIKGYDNIGLIGYNNSGTIKENNISNITVSGNQYIGGLVGTDKTGNIVAINSNNINVTGNQYIGGIVGNVTSGTVNEVVVNNVTATASQHYVGGVVGYSNGTNPTITSVLASNINIKGIDYVSGAIGGVGNPSTITGIVENGYINSTCAYINSPCHKGRVYSTHNVGVNGTSYASNLVTGVTTGSTTISSEDIQDLGYYGSLLYNDSPIIESKYTGDINNTGYYFDYGSDGYIKIVPVGSSQEITPTPSIEIDPNYTMTNVVDGIAPTCELYYVVPVSNGIRASFSCTDDEDIPEVRSLFDSTTEKSAATFDAIGTLKSGSVSGTTKTVISTWNVNNPVSIPTPGTCYYFRYGAKDSKGNFSTYVTNICYKGFSS